MSRIVILGGAESGTGAAVLAKVKGYDVFLSDMGEIAPQYIETLKKWDTCYYTKTFKGNPGIKNSYKILDYRYNIGSGNIGFIKG